VSLRRRHLLAGLVPLAAVAALALPSIGAAGPAPTITSPAGPTFSTNSLPSFHWTSGDTAHSTGYLLQRQPGDCSGGFTTVYVQSGGSHNGSFTEPGPLADGVYCYEVVESYDNAPDGTSGTVLVTYDTTPPAVPAQPSATASPTKASPAISWTAVTDAASYNVYRDGSLIANVTATSFTDSALAVDGSYSYTVSALDALGNQSSQSPGTTVVYDTTPPAPPSQPSATTPTRFAPALTWTAVGGAASYNVYRGVTLLGNVTTPSFTDGALAVDGAYTYTVTSLDTLGNESAASVGRSVTYDTTPPAVPAQPAAAASPTNAKPSLTWPGVSGAANYNVYRGGSYVGTTASPSFTDSALATDGSYDYTVTSLDSLGNESAPSGVRTVVYDTTPPPVPAQPSATSPTKSKPALSWTSVSGAATYNVYRGATLLGNTAGSSFTDTALAADGSYDYTVTSLDALGNESAPSPVRTVVYDTTPPPAPSQPSATSPTNSKPALTWGSVSGASTYDVYRGATLIGNTASTTFTDSALAADGTYTYTVTSLDGLGNESAPSLGKSVTYDTTPPAVPAQPSAASPTKSKPALNWTSVSGAASYNVYRGGSLVGNTAVASFTDSALVADGSYDYTVTSLDALGNESAASAARTVVYDTTPPSAPAVPSATSPTKSKPALSWNSVGGAATYNVYRGATLLGNTAGTAFTDNALSSDGSHDYTVTALDGVGNESGPSPVLTVVYDTTPPAAPTQPSATSPTKSKPALSWSAVGGAATYNVYRGTTLVGNTAGTSFTDTALAADGSYDYTVTSLDGLGNESNPSPARTVVYDTTAPATPGQPAAASPTNVKPSLTWTPVSGATGYNVYRDGTFVSSVAAGAFTDTLLSADGSYAYTVTSFDDAGNESAPSTARTVVYDTQAPSAPAQPTAAASPTNAKPSLTWGAVAGATSYNVYRSGTAIANVSTPSFTDSGLVADGSYSYTITALDDATNESAPSPARAVVYDTTAPTQPTGLDGLPTSNNPVLSWNASSDANGVTGYNVYRNGSLVGTVVATTFTDLTVPNDGTWTYTVKAFDGAGNVSNASSAKAVVVDHTNSSAPQNLAAASPTNGAPHLTWSAPSLFAADHYLVYRDGAGTPLATNVTATSYDDTDPNLTQGTHTYQVVAADSVNTLGISASVQVTYDTVAPLAPPMPSGASPTRVAPTIVWAASPSQDVASYAVYRNGVKVAGGLHGSSYTDGTVGDGSYTYAVSAVDQAGNESTPSPAVTVVHDTAPPSTPGSVGATAQPNGQVVLTWAASSDALTSVTGYTVRRSLAGGPAPAGLTDGDPVCTTTGAGTCTDDSATRGSTYQYSVFATDAAGNVSGAGTSTQVTVPAATGPDHTPPHRPGHVTATVHGTHVRVSWTNPTDADFDHVLVVVNPKHKPTSRNDGTKAYSGSGRSVTVSAKPGSAEHFAVFAYDQSGNASAAVYAAATLPAAGPMSPPSGSVLSGTAHLTWRTVAKATYYNVQVYLAKKRVAIAWPRGTSWAVPGGALKKGQTYTWYVWPGLGPQKAAHYGSLIGKATFTYHG
jgi:fibronectin type 3 domain-containing protein